MITARSLAASAIYDLILLKQKEKAQADERWFVRRSRVCQLESEERQVCVPERARPDVIGNITRQRFKVQVISQYHRHSQQTRGLGVLCSRGMSDGGNGPNAPNPCLAQC
jgi:hypothetical protein